MLINIYLIMVFMDKKLMVEKTFLK
jgi:hypothetical protein